MLSKRFTVSCWAQPCLCSGVVLDLRDFISCHLLEEMGPIPVTGTAGHGVNTHRCCVRYHHIETKCNMFPDPQIQCIGLVPHLYSHILGGVNLYILLVIIHI